MARRKRLTLDKHREYARILHQCHAVLTRIRIELTEHYGVTSSPSRNAANADTWVANLLMTLDTQVSIEYPELPNAEVKAVYYPQDHATIPSDTQSE